MLPSIVLVDVNDYCMIVRSTVLAKNIGFIAFSKTNNRWVFETFTSGFSAETLKVIALELDKRNYPPEYIEKG